MRASAHLLPMHVRDDLQRAEARADRMEVDRERFGEYEPPPPPLAVITETPMTCTHCGRSAAAWRLETFGDGARVRTGYTTTCECAAVPLWLRGQRMPRSYDRDMMAAAHAALEAIC